MRLKICYIQAHYTFVREQEATFEEFATFDAPNLTKPSAAPAMAEKFEPLAHGVL